jgi:hypothetical protein
MFDLISAGSPLEGLMRCEIESVKEPEDLGMGDTGYQDVVVGGNEADGAVVEEEEEWGSLLSRFSAKLPPNSIWKRGVIQAIRSS